MGAVTFTPGTFYECKGRIEFVKKDVEPFNTGLTLKPGDYLRCSKIVFRSGSKGRGHYAKLHYRWGQSNLVLYHRVSKNRIGSGSWEEMNEMMVLALADVLALD